MFEVAVRKDIIDPLKISLNTITYEIEDRLKLYNGLYESYADSRGVVYDEKIEMQRCIRIAYGGVYNHENLSDPPVFINPRFGSELGFDFRPYKTDWSTD